ncbi:hypothetical protein [Secundilactobacillus mixtipabuli]|uniref:Uncharacterized protein n=1 Tax=Secundilactobacillus mixtipabuli TaxID=1435342 RepID=A0A1Z5IAS5_9LACO|nr:hypothetical protein [Secundilactobacillus mixtipabuli]GAW98725.1 hypothetical protein IWT30_00684 [Secundilactobacillus mixtipabuli]
MNSKNFIAGYNRGFENSQKTEDNRKSRLAKLRKKYKKQATGKSVSSPKQSRQSDGDSTTHQQVRTIRQLRKEINELSKKRKADQQSLKSIQQDNFRLKGQVKRLRSEQVETNKHLQTLIDELERAKADVRQNYIPKTVYTQQIEGAKTKDQQQRTQINNLKQGNRDLRKRNRQLSHVNEETRKHLHTSREVLKNNQVATDLLQEQKKNQRLNSELTDFKEKAAKMESQLQWYMRANDNLKHKYSRYKIKKLTKHNSEELLDSVRDDILDQYIKDNITLSQAIHGLNQRVSAENAKQTERLLEPVLDRMKAYFDVESSRYVNELTKLNNYREKQEKKIDLQKSLVKQRKDRLIYSTNSKKHKVNAEQAAARLNISVNQELARKVLKGAKIVIIDWQKTYPVTKDLTRYGAEVMAFNDGNYHYNRLQTVLNREDLDLIVINPNGMHHEVGLIINNPSFQYRKRVLNLNQLKDSHRNAFDEIVWWLNGMRSRGEK